MEKMFAELKNGLPVNVDIQNAIDGFISLGYEIYEFTAEDLESDKMDYRATKYPFVGSIDGMTELFKNIGKYPEPIDFPESIIESGLLNRNVVKTTLNKFIGDFKQNHKPMFVKPVQTKLFDGALISKEEHLNYLKMSMQLDKYVETSKHNNAKKVQSLYSEIEDCNIFITEPIDIVSEHRVYVHNKKAIYSCNYSGDFRINPDFGYVDKLIEMYQEQPVAYTIDVAILKDGSMTVIEFNDFWAIGSYGLYCIDYAQMLLDRYFEIVIG